MAYTETAVLHDGTYTPPGPVTEYGRRARPVDGNATTTITVIQHDDSTPVPAATDPELEYERWTLSVSVEQARKLEIRREAEAAMDQLATIRDASSLTTQQAVNAIQFEAQVLRRLIRLVTNLLDGTD